MSEVRGEMAAPVEKESPVVKKMGERVGAFLSEHYTFKGAKAKELRAMDAVVAGFTPAQESQMRAYFEAKAEKNAKWKVIRNWVATGAGLALGGVIAAHPAAAFEAVMGVGKIVTGWWHGLTGALSSAGAGASASWETAKHWVFDYANRPNWVIDTTSVRGDLTKWFYKPFADAYASVSTMTATANIHPIRDVSVGLQPLWASIREGLKFPMPIVTIK